MGKPAWGNFYSPRSVWKILVTFGAGECLFHYRVQSCANKCQGLSNFLSNLDQVNVFLPACAHLCSSRSAFLFNVLNAGELVFASLGTFLLFQVCYFVKILVTFWAFECVFNSMGTCVLFKVCFLWKILVFNYFHIWSRWICFHHYGQICALQGLHFCQMSCHILSRWIGFRQLGHIYALPGLLFCENSCHILSLWMCFQ